MTVRIGANPIGWSNDDLHELGGETPLETCLAEAHEAGYEGMELGHKFPRQPEALRAALSPFGLDLVSGWYSAELLRRDAEAEIEALWPHLDLLKALGATVCVFAETSNAIHGMREVPLSRRPVMEKDDWAEFGRRLTTVAGAMLAEGVRMVYHHHMGTIVQSANDIDALMAATGEAVHLLLDTGHAYWGGADPVALARTYRDRISHVHCKDVRADVLRQATDGDWSFLDSVVAGIYTVPGDGVIDFTAVLKELPGYDGWLVVEAEQDPEKAPPLEYATLGCRNLAAYAREAGLT